MSTVTRFDHPTSLDAPEMFVLRAEADIWGQALEDKVGDLDMYETAELAFSLGMNPQYEKKIRLVASDRETPGAETEILGVATLELPMVDNPRLATISIAVRRERRREGIASALHADALELARKCGRTTIQAWTWEPLQIPDGARVLTAETGSGAVEANSRESRFLADRRYVLGQVERISRLELPNVKELEFLRNEALEAKPRDYELITFTGLTPERLRDDAAALRTAMAVDSPAGAMDLEEELWDAERVRTTDAQVEVADRDQLQTLVRHVPSGQVVGFTRFLRDRSRLAVAHQWETVVLGNHRGHGLGKLMKVVNHAAVATFWPEVSRLVTGNASENRHMLAINDAMGYQPYAASGFWELRRGALG